MDSLVSTEWLAGEIGASDLRIVDASRHLADAGRDPEGEYLAAHIPGAVFMDLGELVDPAATVDNTLPSAERFASYTQTLGLGDGSRIVVYDDSAIKSATRAWFMLKLFGARDVAVLDGGIAKWRAEGRPLASGKETLRHRHFTVWSDPKRVRDKAEVLANLGSDAELVLDARGAGRFTGTDAETRPGLASGHIPGSRNVHYAKLYNPDGTFKDKAAIKALFADTGIDLSRPLITSCGSGMTACALTFALHLIGKEDVSLYDGSWSEWGLDPATPKAVGAA